MVEKKKNNKENFIFSLKVSTIVYGILGFLGLLWDSLAGLIFLGMIPLTISLATGCITGNKIRNRAFCASIMVVSPVLFVCLIFLTDLIVFSSTGTIAVLEIVGLLYMPTIILTALTAGYVIGSLVQYSTKQNTKEVSLEV